MKSETTRSKVAALNTMPSKYHLALPEIDHYLCFSGQIMNKLHDASGSVVSV